MRIAEINTLDTGSTGKIMFALADLARKDGNTVITFSAKIFRKRAHDIYSSKPNHFFYLSKTGSFVHKCLGQITGLNGCFSVIPTLSLCKKLKKEKIEIIHLHNLHDFCINLPILFSFIKKNNIKVVWTLHDCWSFTGHCPHFTMAKCDKWKLKCHHCPQLRYYPKSYLDTSELMWNLKKKWFNGIDNLTIVTPSNWLANLVKQSFLHSYSVKVINNGIDLSVFKPYPNNVKERYNLSNKYVVLGVSFEWGVKKGLDVFIELSKVLNNRFQIVLVGTNDKIDSFLPANIISIHRTNNQKELAQIYSAADLFLNPTREENYPTVNMESIACGTPVLTFNTGGCPETIDKYTGEAIDEVDIMTLKRKVEYICQKNVFSSSDCIKKAQEYSQSARFNEYLKLYNDLYTGKNSI